MVQFLDTPTGRTYHILMEGVPGQIPAPANHLSGVTIIDPADLTRRGWGTYVFAEQPRRALCLSAPHPHDDLDKGASAPRNSIYRERSTFQRCLSHSKIDGSVIQVKVSILRKVRHCLRQLARLIRECTQNETFCGLAGWSQGI
jgi:hypothetical protein